MRGLTCSTLFGLIAVTGLRISEALRSIRDLDVENGVLRVRRGKLGKERLLPLDPSVVRLAAMLPSVTGCSAASEAFFVTCNGTGWPTAAHATTSRRPASRSACANISVTAGTAADRASTIFATASRRER